MASSRTDPSAAPVDDAAAGSALVGAAGVGPALVIGVALAAAVFAAAMALAVGLIHPDPTIITTRFGDQQNQSVKTALYLLTFAVLFPVAGLAGTRSADRIARGPNAPFLGGLSAALVAALAAVVLLVKASTLLPRGEDLRLVLGTFALWLVCAVAVLRRAGRREQLQALRPLAGRGQDVGAVACALVFAAILCFTHLSRSDVVVLVPGLALIGAGIAVVQGRRVPHLRRPWGPAVDVLAVVGIALAVPDLVIFTTSEQLPNLFFPPGIIQFHHDFLLGPTNQVVRGGTLLVDSPVSQYGVGSVYFLAAWFHLAPIGYGTYGLLDGILTAAFYATGYAVLRVAGASRLLAVPAMAVAVTVFVLDLAYPIGSLPQQGPLRFGLPLALVLATVAGERSSRHIRSASLVSLAVVGLSSIWALEAFVYTGVTFVALTLARSCLGPAGARLRFLVRSTGAAVLACVCAQLVLAAATVAATGQLPDWTQYFAYLKVFLGGGAAGKLTYGFAPWSPALPLAAGLGGSALAVVLVMRRRPEIVARHSPLLIALAGLTGYAIALLSYTQNRSSTYLLPYISLPALLIGALWTTLAQRSAPRALRTGTLAFVLGIVLVMLLSTSGVGDRFSRTALAHARPGGGLRAALTRLWDAPPIDPRAPAGQRLLDRFLPGQSHVLILLPGTPELAVEILMRSDRGNRLPIGNPVEEGFVPTVWAPPLRRAIARLEPGERILLNRETLSLLATLQRRPGFDPLAHPEIGTDPLELFVGLELLRRFDLRTVARGPRGFIVAELARPPEAKG